MKFRRQFLSSQAPEWEEFYLGYEHLRKIARKTREFKFKATIRFGKEQVSSFSANEKQFLNALKNEFEDFLVKEIQKFNRVHRFLINRVEKVKLIQIALNFKNYHNTQMSKTQKKKFWSALKSELERFYTEIVWISNFAKTNLQASFRSLRLYRKYFSQVGLFSIETEKALDFMIRHSFSYRTTELVSKMSTVVEILYSRHLQLKSQREVYIKLQNIYLGDVFTSSEAGAMGLLVGAMVSGIVILIFVLLQVRFFEIDDNTFVRYVFPLFRGIFLIYFFMLIWGITVYLWNKYKIDYTRVLLIEVKHSSPFWLIMRALILMTLVSLLFIYCCVSYILEDDSFFKPFFSKEASIYLPCVPWLLSILWILYSLRSLCMPRSNAWLWKTFLRYMYSPFYNHGDDIIWFGAQTFSFSIVCRDFAYFLCYFPNALNNNSEVNTCFESTTFVVFEYIYNITPIAYRMFLFFCKLRYVHNPEIRFLYHCLNVLLLSSIATTIMGSYIGNPIVLAIWIVLVACGALYSGYVDLKWDWDFFKEGSKNFLLRDTLLFKHKWPYYLATFINFFFRFSWIITLQPIALFSSTLESQLAGLMSGFFEMIRRGTWNLFAIEVFHINKMRKYRILDDLDLPYKFPISMSQDSLRSYVDRLFEQILYEGLAKANSIWGVPIPNRLDVQIDEVDPMFTPDQYLQKDIDYLEGVRAEYNEYLIESIENIAILKNEFLGNNIVFVKNGKSVDESRKFIPTTLWSSKVPLKNEKKIDDEKENYFMGMLGEESSEEENSDL